MKRLISLILFLTMVVILIGCAGMTGQQPSDKDSLTNEVGKAPFVGHVGAAYRGDSSLRMVSP
jgi:Asp/Glu/hydantoin racemase